MRWAKGSFFAADRLPVRRGSCHASTFDRVHSAQTLASQAFGYERCIAARCSPSPRPPRMPARSRCVPRTGHDLLAALSRGAEERLAGRSRGRGLHVTGDANAMRVLLSGNADIASSARSTCWRSINAGASIRAVHFLAADWRLQPRCWATGRGAKLADVAGKIFASSGPGACRSTSATHHAQAASMKPRRVFGSRWAATPPASRRDRRPRRCDAGATPVTAALKGVKDGKVTVGWRDCPAEFPGLGYVWNARAHRSARETRACRCLPGHDRHRHPPRIALHQWPIPRGRGDSLPSGSRSRPAFSHGGGADLQRRECLGVNGGLDPAIEEFTADLNVKLGNLPVAAPAKDVLEPRFVERASPRRSAITQSK